MPFSETDRSGEDEPRSARERGDASDNYAIGHSFEKLTATYFKQNGFDVLERNYRAGRKEIDLIVRRDDLIVFVEVKSASTRRFGHPVERVDEKKVANITIAARHYLVENEISGCDLRFDVVTFLDGQLEHFPGAFTAPD